MRLMMMPQRDRPRIDSRSIDVRRKGPKSTHHKSTNCMRRSDGPRRAARSVRSGDDDDARWRLSRLPRSPFPNSIGGGWLVTAWNAKKRKGAVAIVCNCSIRRRAGGESRVCVPCPISVRGRCVRFENSAGEGWGAGPLQSRGGRMAGSRAPETWILCFG